MWELCCNIGSGVIGPRICSAPAGFINKCPVCGKSINADEYFYIIMSSNVPPARFANLHNNSVHIGCWEYMCNNIKTDEELITKLQKHNQKEVPVTHLMKMRGKAFKTVMQSYGMDCSSLVRGEIKAKTKANRINLGSFASGEYIYFALTNKLLYIPPNTETRYYVSDGVGCANNMLLDVHNKIRDVLCEPRLNFDLSKSNS